MDIKIDIIRTAARYIPSVLPHLTGRARWIALTAPRDIQHDETKTVEFYFRTLRGLVLSVYNGDMRTEFIDIMANLIQGQLTQAWLTALGEAGLNMTPEMQAELDGYILNEYTFVDGYYRDILNAGLLNLPIDPLIQRARIWANRWNDIYNAAKLYIASQYGDRMVWVYGDTDHCTTCEQLNGIVAFAREWEQLNIRPQNPPNPLLECGGWRCQCRLEVTDRRRSPKAFDTILNIVGGV